MSHMPPGIGPIAIELTRGIVSVRDYGAVGDGVTDDTTAWVNALATGRRVIGYPGDTYLLNGGLVVGTVGQVVDMTDCKVKLKTAAASKIIIQLNAARARIVGGDWDMNLAGNATGNAYTYVAVSMTADHTVVDSIYIHDSYGLGILGSGAYNYREVRNCRVENCRQQGVFFDGPTTANSVGTTISGCTIIVPDVNGGGGPVGIYVHSTTPATFSAIRYRIINNTLVGPTAPTLSQVGITGRGIDGIVTGNHVYNFDIGISIDSSVSQRTVIADNRVEAVVTRLGGIEINGGYSAVVGNIVIGHQFGIFGSTQAQNPTDNLDAMLIGTNQLINQTVRCIQMTPAATNTGYRINIIGNTMTSTTAMNGMVALRADCRHALFMGNLFKGLSSADGEGILLEDASTGHSIRGNKFSGLERTVQLYSASAVNFTNVSFENNDVSEDIGAADSEWLSLAGTATRGTGCVWRNNYTGTAMRSVSQGTSTAPATGTWLRGDIAWVNDPAEAGHAGWICTTGGTPGTWRKFGHIFTGSNPVFSEAVTLGDSDSGDGHTVHGRILHTTSGLSDGYGLTATQAAATFIYNGMSSTASGTYDATAAGRENYAMKLNANATRTGANTLFNIAVKASSSGGQDNRAFWNDTGDNHFNSTSGTSTFFQTLAINGNLTAGNASSDAHVLNGNITLQNAPTAGSIKVGSLNARVYLGRQILTAASGTYTK